MQNTVTTASKKSTTAKRTKKLRAASPALLSHVVRLPIPERTDRPEGGVKPRGAMDKPQHVVMGEFDRFGDPIPGGRPTRVYEAGKWYAVDAATAEELERTPLNEFNPAGSKHFEGMFDILTREQFEALKAREMKKFDAQARAKINDALQVEARRVMGVSMSAADSFAVVMPGGK